MSCKISLAIFRKVELRFSQMRGRNTERKTLHIIIYARAKIEYHFADFTLEDCLVLVGELPFALDVLIEDTGVDANGQHARTRLDVVSVGEFGVEIFLEADVVACYCGSNAALRAEQPYRRIYAQIGCLGRAFHAHPLVAIDEHGVYGAVGAAESRVVTRLIEHEVAVMRILLRKRRCRHRYSSE